uniref:Uncharacterized protein n=1 Tax=Cannabis sativa TaxID=3483 RepID=A0A803Q801_CANSA
MLETKLRQTREHCDVMAKKWNDSESELSRAEADRKLEEAKVDTKNRVIRIVRRSINQAWLANLERDFSFLGKGAEDMLPFWEKTNKEEV